MASGTSTSSNFNADVESDGHLIELVRGGDMSAFDDLYERHMSIASTVARRNVDNPSDAEDVVAEAFQSVLQSLVAGKGPDNFFRAYLLSTVTRLSHHRNRKAGRTLPSGDDSLLDSTLAEPDAAIKAFESHTVAKAFRELPERWQAVLWYLDVERMKPAAVAPILGLSANAVSALALRAREGLRRQYLQAHVAEEPDSDCAYFASKLGNFIRGGLSGVTERKVREHLKGCSKCTLALSELKDVQGSMRAVLLPLVTGIPLAAWAGKSAGLGVLGGLVPVKAAIVVPVLAQPAMMAVVAATGLGLVLGAVGIVDRLAPNAYMEQRAVETSSAVQGPSVVPPTPTPSTGAPPGPAPDPTASVEPAPQAAAPKPPAAGAEPPVPIPEPSTVEPPSSEPVTAAPVPSSQTVTPSQESLASVTAKVSEERDRDYSTTAMRVAFSADGSPSLGPGKAVFSVEEGSWIREGSVLAPDGWSCSVEGRNILTCITDAVERTDLHFHLTAESRHHRDSGVLKYSLSGKGLAAGEFVYNY